MHRSRVLSRRLCLLAAAIAWSPGLLPSVLGAENVTVQKVLTGLKSPRGVTVRPDDAGEQSEIFIAESGAGRVTRLSSGQPGKTTDIIAGFASPSASDENLQSPGVQSLRFLDHTRLVVGGGDDDGKPFARLYELPESNKPLTADQHKQDVELPLGDAEQQTEARTLRGIARTRPNNQVGDLLIVAAAGDQGPAGLMFIPVRAGTLEGAVVDPAVARDVVEAGGISVSNNGYIVVAGASHTNGNRSSALRFLNPLNRHAVMQVSVDLRRIVALAYSPKSGNLYAANFPTPDDGHSGVYRLDEAGEPGAPACAAVKIAGVRRPTALAFDPHGALYVTALSESARTTPDTGLLVKLTGDL